MQRQRQQQPKDGLCEKTNSTKVIDAISAILFSFCIVYVCNSIPLGSDGMRISGMSLLRINNI